MKILQCHTKGDKRFSPFCCYISAFNLTKSIEDHYQSAKRFEGKPAPKNWREAKALQKAGIKRIGFELPNGIWLPPDTNNTTDLAIQFYIALWYKYLKLNPHLIAIASEYDEFADIFKGKFPFCQADVISKCVKEGVESLKPMCADFFNLCSKFMTKDILTIECGIIAHQVNCQGKMGAGLAKQIRAKYPQAYDEYMDWFEDEKMKLGTVQLVKIKPHLYVANLAGQEQYGLWRTQKNRCHTDYQALTECLTQLQEIAQERKLTPYLPFKIGCGLAGGDWSIVYDLILKHCPSAKICKL
jgi:O-acetyl-ADP-ribose deacetylase (regulator of RNase III)